MLLKVFPLFEIFKPSSTVSIENIIKELFEDFM